MSMKILDRYVAKTVLTAIGLVTLMLTGLQVFILFLNQIGPLGHADYGIAQVSVFVLLQLPYQVYLFFPMASLIGSLIGLGTLANHSELVVMRAAGMSIGQITGSVLKASIVVVLLVTCLGETLVPQLFHYSNDYKAAALSGGQSIRTGHGIWVRSANDFILIGKVLPDVVLQDIYQFRFDLKHNLQFARHIREAKSVNKIWVAYDVEQTEFSTGHTNTKTLKSILWDVPVKPQILKISTSEPDEMSLHELNQYLREQKHNQQNTHNYQLAFLQRIIQPITTMVMMILAIPFIFGPLRSSTMGLKMVIGISVGFGFYIMNHFMGPVSMVYQLSPVLAAFGPTFVFALIGLWLMRKVR
ncbi:MAG: LPS export ABC transporter permease LptG [Legionellales bacterium]